MEGNIYINGLIGTIYNSDFTVREKGVELIDVIKQVQGNPSAELYNVYINSEGGVVETGFEIYDYLKSLGKPVNTIGLGQVASIATVVFMAGEKRYLKPATNFLIHLPMIGIDGFLNSQDLELAKQSVAVVEKQLLDFYKKQTGLSEEALLPLLKKETSLTPSDAFDLNFATEYTVEFAKAVAYLKPININTNNNMTNEDKSWLEKLFAPILNKKDNQIVNITVTDADGVIIDFPDVPEGTEPKVGDKATIDGKPADGDYLMPDGMKFIFAMGELTEIAEPETEDNEEMTALKAENETLKADLEASKLAFVNLEKSVVNLKKQITSRFETIDKKEGKKEDAEEKDPTNRAAGMLNRIKQKN
jgi:ATP-dependent protease ClpP protease subunit